MVHMLFEKTGDQAAGSKDILDVCILDGREAQLAAGNAQEFMKRDTHPSLPDR